MMAQRNIEIQELDLQSDRKREENTTPGLERYQPSACDTPLGTRWEIINIQFALLVHIAPSERLQYLTLMEKNGTKIFLQK